MRSPTILLLALLSAGAFARPALAASVPATVSATLMKPVTLSKVRDLDFGTLAFGGFTGTRTISLTRAGAFTCAANIVCSGVPRTARFNIKGVDGLFAVINVASTSLTNGTDTIPFTANAPFLVFIVGAGVAGVDFDIGGSITVQSALVGGVYSGTMTVTADYY